MKVLVAPLLTTTGVDGVIVPFAPALGVTVKLTGAAVGVTVVDAPELTLVPIALVAVTRQLTATPAASPVTMIGEEVPTTGVAGLARVPPT